jgi:hypothetical protein
MSMLVKIIPLALTLFLSGCGNGGEEDICQRASEISNKYIYEGCREVVERDDCWPCYCLCMLKGRHFTIVPDAQGLPDLQMSICDSEDPCVGTRLEWAEECLSDVDKCSEGAVTWEDTIFGRLPCGPPFDQHTDPADCNWQ